MSSASSATTLLVSGGLLLLALLHCAHCLSEGQRCNIQVPDQCDSGLTCVASGSSAYCRTNVSPCNSCPELWCGPELQYTPEGQCCPQCPPPPTVLSVPAGCTVDGVHRSEGERWETDSCTSCQCIDGQPLCSTISCAPLTCTTTVVLPGECCPTCLEMSVLDPAPLSNKCIMDGQEYDDGERWRPVNAGPCVRAYCDQGEILHYSRQCEYPQCDNPVYDPNVCCPICPDIPESVVEQPAAIAPTPAPECVVENGVVLKDGEKHCPAPNVTVYCNAGQMEISNHCPPLDCADIVPGQGECDCPVCVENARHFEVGGRLHMNLLQFARSASATDSMLKQLARDSGLYPDHNDFDRCSGIICLRMNVLSSNMNATETDVVQAVRKELESKPHEGLEIGYVGDFFTTEKRSVRSVEGAPESNKLSLSSSSSSDQDSSVVPTAIAVSASVLGVVGTVVGVALLASFVRRRNTVRSTITV